MKTLVAAISLVCLSSTVLAHDIYSKLRDRDGHRCRPHAPARPCTHKIRPNVRFDPKATELLRGREMTRSATRRHSGTASLGDAFLWSCSRLAWRTMRCKEFCL